MLALFLYICLKTSGSNTINLSYLKGTNMLQYTEGDLTIKETKLHYYRTGGNKPPIVLLHGATDNGLCWTTLAETLAAQYDVIMPDAQGHGLSDRLDPATSFESYAQQVAGLVKALGLKNPIIMGHSMGADTAANVAVMYPELPRAIILEDPPWGMPEPDPKMAETEQKEAAQRVGWLMGLRNLSLEDAIEESRKSDPQWPEAERLPWAKAKQQFDVSLFENMIVNPRSYDELVPKIKCPTLLIIAEQGIVTRQVAEHAAKLWKAKHPFKWVQIKDATHNIRRDNFQDYRDAVLSFLKYLPA
jgi:pimeloyl-ACP methyl ester carboxylesterase